MSASRYREYAPPRPLRDRILCLWIQRIDRAAGDYAHPVLPDGCVDIVWIGDAAPVVAGPATRRVTVNLPAGIRLFGLRFRPGWAAACLGIPASELRDLEVPLGDLWRDAPRTLTPLFARFSASAIPDAAVRGSVEWLAREPAARVHELARLTGVGERQLHRRFRESVGYGPKTFQRVMRFQRLLAAVPARGGFAGAALDAGYADQAHMCREVRELASATLSDLFKTVAAGQGILELSTTRSLHETANQPDHPGRR